MTSYGKTLYSRGRLNPSHYAFFDHDVIYDDQYGCSSGNVDQRILETPRSRLQIHKDGARNRNEVSFDGVPTDFMDNYESAYGLRYLDSTLAEEKKRKDIFLPIGHSSNDSKYYPAWRSYMLLGSTDSAVPYFYFGDTTGSVVNIPQIEVKKRIFTEKGIRGTDDNSAVYGHIFPDGSSVTLEETEDAELLLYLQEKNSTSDDKNFNVEVYEVKDEANEEILYPLKFKKTPQFNRIVDGIMLDHDPSSDADLMLRMILGW